MASAALAGQQALANNATLAGLNSLNYTQALGEFNNQQTTQLGAAQANRTALQQGSELNAGLAGTASSTGIANANAQLEGGALQQQTQQAGDQAQYGQFENAQAFPYQQANFLAGITDATAPNLGSTTTGESTTQGSWLNGLIGLGTAGLGAFAKSDARLKEDARPVGKTFDGQTLYAYRFKGDPRTQVGLMAQEVEHHHPHAVAKGLGGVLHVDYAAATRAAADKGHFARGGRTADEHLGLGAARMYANGGIASEPYADAQSYVPSLTGGFRGGLGGARMGGSPMSMGSGQATSPQASAGTLLGQGLGAFAASPLGSDLKAGLGTMFSGNFTGLKRGGAVGLAAAARRYDGGGVVSPFGDVDPSVFDQPAVNLPIEGTPFASQSGLGAAVAPPSAPPPPAPMPVPQGGSLGSAASGQPVPINPDGAAAGYTPPGGAGLASASIAPQAPTNALAAINQVAPQGGFGAAVSRTMGFEGGYNPSDANGSPSNFGINQAANPDVDVSKLTSDGAKALYKTRYWDAIGGDKLSPALQGPAFDTAVIAGPQKAKDLIAASGGDPAKFMELRHQFLGGLVASDPQKYGQYANSWASRDAALSGEQGGGGQSGGLGNAVLGYSGTGGLGQFGASSGLGGAGGGLGNAVTSSTAPDDGSNTSFFDTLKGAFGGDGPGLSENARLGLITAGLGIAGSNSMNPLQAIGQGGLGGVEAYMKGRQLQNEQALQRAQVANIGSEIGQRNFDQVVAGRKLQGLAAVGAALNGSNGSLGSAGLGGASPSSSTAPPTTSGSGAPPVSGNVGADANTLIGNIGKVGASLKAGTARNAQAPATPGVPQPNAAPMTASDQLAPSSSPAYLDQQADVYQRAANAAAAYDPEASRGYSETANQFRERSSRLQQSGFGTTTDGRVVTLPGYTAAKGQVAGAEEQARAGYRLREVEPTPGGPTQYATEAQILGGAGAGSAGGPGGVGGTGGQVGAGSPPGSATAAGPIVAKQPGFYAKKQDQIADNENTMLQNFQGRQVARQRLQDLQGILETYQSGAFAEEKADLAAKLQAAHIPVPQGALDNTVNFEKFTKETTGGLFDHLGALGGEVLATEIEGLSRTVSQPDIQPAANASIIGQALGVMDHEDAHTSDYFDWKKANPNATDTSTFELPWAKAHPVEPYVRAQRLNTATSDPLPPRGKLVDGQAYMVPGPNGSKQKGLWNASAGTFLPPGARRAPDGNFYVTDPSRPGSYLRVR